MAKIDDCLLEIENLLNKRHDLVLVDYLEPKMEDNEIYKVHHLRIESKEEHLPMQTVPIEVAEMVRKEYTKNILKEKNNGREGKIW